MGRVSNYSMDLLARALQEHFGLTARGIFPVSGGDIGRAFRVDADTGSFFLKWYDGPNAYNRGLAEAGGLAAIAGARALRTPAVAGCAELSAGALLLLEYLPAKTAAQADFEQLGRGLAAIHNQTHACFGWETDNFIGRLPQRNEPCSDWPEFYAGRRLLPQYRMALASGLLSGREVPDAGLLSEKIRALAPHPEPSLLHGDLWSGNFLISEAGEACLIDPAVYAGDAEADLAMTRLFGGFPEPFYRAYHEIRPEKDGMDRRISLYQLYYLLVHLNLFGAGYAGSVRRFGRDLFGL